MIEDDDDDDFVDETSEGRTRSLQESVKKAVASGINAVLTTEEGIRSRVTDMRLPKEAVAFIVQQTEKSRRELLNSVADEVRGMFRNMDVPGEIRKGLAGLKLEVKAEIRLVDEREGKTPSRSDEGKRGAKTTPKKEG